MSNNLIPKAKKGKKWIQGAVNPEHKGYCTPMTKSTCTPRRKAFAMTMKKHHGFHKKDDGGKLVPIGQQGMDLGKLNQARTEKLGLAQRSEPLSQNLLRTASETRMRAPGDLPLPKGIPTSPVTPPVTPPVKQTLIPRPGNLAPMPVRPATLAGPTPTLQKPQITSPYTRMDESSVKPYTAWPIAYRAGNPEDRGNTIVGTMSVPQINPKAPWQNVDLTRNSWGSIKGGLSPELRQKLESKYKLTDTLNATVNPESQANAEFAVGAKELGTFTANNQVTTPTSTKAVAPALVERQSYALKRKDGGTLIQKNQKGGGLSGEEDRNPKGSKKDYPMVKSKDFAGGDRSYPIPTKADAVDALRLAGLHGRADVKAKVYKKYPELKK